VYLFPSIDIHLKSFTYKCTYIHVYEYIYTYLGGVGASENDLLKTRISMMMSQEKELFTSLGMYIC
jgi:hypothetical protein